MERLLIQGGHEYLPFARSRIRALKALGMRYVSQTYVVNGVTINVSLENGNPVISIRGDDLAGWTMNPQDEAGRYGYVQDPDSGEQVPFAPEGLDEPEDGEDASKTRNPYVFLRPSGATQEETKRIGGSHFWSNWKGERLLFGAGGTLSYKQKRVVMQQEGEVPTDLLATGGAIARSEAGKHIIFAVDAGLKTEFYAVPWSLVNSASDMEVIGPVEKLGETEDATHSLEWRFSPDGLSAVAVEGRISSSSEAHTDTDFFRYTDDTRSTFTGQQKIHRATFTPSDSDAGFTVEFTSETVEDAIVKCVPTVSFVTRLMAREYVEYPTYVRRFECDITYTFSHATPGDEFAPVDGPIVGGAGDPLLVGPYPASFRADPLPVENNPDGNRYFVFDTGASTEVTIGIGTTQIGANLDGSSGGVLNRVPTFTFEGDEENSPLEIPEAVAMLENANGGAFIPKIADVLSGMTRVPGSVYLDPSLDLWGSWSAFRETMTLLGESASYREGADYYDPEASGAVLVKPIMTALAQSRFTVIAPFDHLVNTHWERVVTFAYTGRRIIDIDYKKDGTETRMELVGDGGSTVVCVQSDKTIIDEDDSTPPRRSAGGNLFYDYTVQGTCRYTLQLDGIEVASSQTQCEAERTSFMEDFTFPGGTEPSFQVERFTASQNVNESSFALRGHDIRHGVILFEEISNQYTENSARLDFGDSVGQLDRTRELFVFTKKDGKRSIERYEDQSLPSSPIGYRHQLHHNGDFVRSITGRSGFHLVADRAKSISGVYFTEDDFSENNGLPTPAGRDKFQELLPPECRDVGGTLGQYLGKYSEGWYQDAQAIQLYARGWFFYETVVLTPSYRTVLQSEALSISVQHDCSLFAVDSDRWLVVVRERFDGEGPYEKHRAYIGNKGKIKPYMPDYLDKETALFDQINISV